MNPSLAGQNIVCFDLETKRPIEGEVTWARHDLMGISVGCLYDWLDGEYKVYMDDNLEELAERLRSADLVTGFNIDGFDMPLLRATLGNPSDDLMPKTYDLLYWSRRSTGWNGFGKFPSGLKLDDHLLGTFGQSFMKTGNGADAPKWYQEKKIGKLTSYCLGDVHREKTLFEHVWYGHAVKTAAHGERVLHNPHDELLNLNPGKYTVEPVAAVV